MTIVSIIGYFTMSLLAMIGTAAVMGAIERTIKRRRDIARRVGGK